MEEPTQARIVIRPLGTPLPLGLYSFGIGMLMLAGQSAGWIPVGQGRDVGIVVATFVFPLESTAAILAFWARDTLAATTLGMFSTSWVTVGVSLITGTPGQTTATLGFYLVGFSAVVATLAVIALSGKPLLSVILAFSAARAVIDGIYEFSGAQAIGNVAGYVAAVLAALAWYAGTAMVVEDLSPSSLLPVFRRGSSRTAVDGALVDQLSDLSREAGIRRPL